MLFAFFIGSPGAGEMLLFGIIAVILFGSRLPEVARSAGKTFVDFKKGMGGFTNELSNITSEVTSAAQQLTKTEDDLPASPSFTPPPETEEAEATTKFTPPEE